MRDIILVAVTGLLILGVFKNPVWGAYLWAWYGLMNPHKLSYGFAFSLPFAQAIAAITLLMWLVARHKRGIPFSSVSALWYLLFIWMTVTSFFALNMQELVVDRWIFVAKIQLMLAVSLMLVVEAKHLKTLVIVVTLSVAFYGIKGGVFTVLTAGSGRVWGPPGSLLEGNNELAVALVMLVPYLFWMRQTLKNRWVKRACMAFIVLCIFSILGSQSRGALLAILAMALFLGLKSGKPVQMSLLLGLGLLVAIAFMPDSWTKRMDTIGTYKDDDSAMSRIWTWTTLFNVAVARPLVGAGFRADAQVVFRNYAPQGPEWSAFDNLVYVAHSIYFQMLGEHGFVGLGLFLGLWAAVWLHARKLIRKSEKHPSLADWLPLLMRMTQVSLIGYLVGGAFLSLAYLDLVYYLMGYVIVADRLVRDAELAPALPPAANQKPGSRAGPTPAAVIDQSHARRS
jgi:probable O-glycosylation ligase (exosortase A-associated)